MILPIRLPLAPFRLIVVADPPLRRVVYVRGSCSTHAVSSFHLPHIFHASYHSTPSAVCFVAAWFVLASYVYWFHAVAIAIVPTWLPHRAWTRISNGIILAVESGTRRGSAPCGVGGTIGLTVLVGFTICGVTNKLPLQIVLHPGLRCVQHGRGNDC